METSNQIIERPVLFQPLMVSAIKFGRKLQTRRLVKIKNPQEFIEAVHPDGSGKGFVFWFGRDPGPEETKRRYPGEVGVKCPYGDVGDRLWVREKWKITGWDWDDSEMRITYANGEERSCEMYDPTDDDEWMLKHFNFLLEKGYIGSPTDEDLAEFDEQAPMQILIPKEQWPWKPSIHMPRSASRILLEITDVRIERLNDISESDAEKEGCFKGKASGRVFNSETEMHFGNLQWRTAIDWFSDLWESINGPESWDANPWVWVVEFKVIEQ